MVQRAHDGADLEFALENNTLEDAGIVSHAGDKTDIFWLELLTLFFHGEVCHFLERSPMLEKRKSEEE